MANDAEHDPYKELYAARDINHMAVQESILDQPQLFGHVAAWAAHYNTIRDDLKIAMDDVASDVQLRIRDEATDKGEKTTEAKVEAMVRVSQEFQVAQKRYNKAKAVASKWQALIETYKQRSYSLTQYVHWRSGDYIHERASSGDHPAHIRRVRQ